MKKIGVIRLLSTQTNTNRFYTFTFLLPADLVNRYITHFYCAVSTQGYLVTATAANGAWEIEYFDGFDRIPLAGNVVNISGIQPIPDSQVVLPGHSIIVNAATNSGALITKSCALWLYYSNEESIQLP